MLEQSQGKQRKKQDASSQSYRNESGPCKPHQPRPKARSPHILSSPVTSVITSGRRTERTARSTAVTIARRYCPGSVHKYIWRKISADSMRCCGVCMICSRSWRKEPPRCARQMPATIPASSTKPVKRRARLCRPAPMLWLTAATAPLPVAMPTAIKTMWHCAMRPMDA